MGAEILLYGYGLVCLSMLVFNVLYALHLRAGRPPGSTGRMADIRRQVSTELNLIQADSNQPVQVSHLTWCAAGSRRVNYLLAFDHLLNELDSSDAAFQSYMRQMQPVFLHLSTIYWRLDDTQAAYYCHFLARHRLPQNSELDQIQRVLLSYLSKGSLYCRLNALKALCSFGARQALSDALEELGRDRATSCTRR